MKATVIATAVFAALCAFGEEAAAPAAPATPAAPAVPAAQPEQKAEPHPDNAATARDTTDVIDLDEVDDSAEAREKSTVVTTAAKEGNMTLVDIACDNATLEDVLRQFRRVTDANIISDDSTNLQRRVSVNLHRVPWLDGLQSILNSRNYRLEERGSILFVKEDKVLEPILTRSFVLNHASASELADLFNKSYGKKDQKGTVTHPIATSFDGANVVVVTATEKTLADCESIIRAVDRAIAQIYIEARFLELSSQAMHKLGVQWNQLESWGATARGMEAGWEYNRGRAADYGPQLQTKSSSTSKASSESMTSSASSSSSKTENSSSSISTTSSGSSSSTSSSMSPSSSSTTSSSSSPSSSRNSSNSSTFFGLVPQEIGPATGAGLSAADMAWRNARGFSGQLSADDFRLALSAFESFGEGRIFSNPKVIVSNGKEANVDMTTKYPNVALEAKNSNSGGGSFDNSYSAKLEQIPGDINKGMFAGSCFFEWGITLSVKPRISPDGLISVEITPTISQLDYDASQDGSGYYAVISANTIGYYPIISMKRITTDFTMKDGSTAVIGGLSRTVEDDVDSGIPFLRKLPWIGQKLFGWKSRAKVQKEIIVCVTIGIANPAELPKDIGLPKNAVMGREYMTGARLEPGDREGSALEVLKLDLRPLDKREEDEDGDESESTDEETVAPEPGKVTITPAK